MKKSEINTPVSSNSKVLQHTIFFNSLSSSRRLSFSSNDSSSTHREKALPPLIDRNRAPISLLPTIFDDSPSLLEKSDENTLLHSYSSKTVCDQDNISQPKKVTSSIYSSQAYSHISIPFDEIEYPPESQEVKNTLGGTQYHIASEFVRLTPLNISSQRLSLPGVTSNSSEVNLYSQRKVHSIYSDNMSTSFRDQASSLNQSYFSQPIDPTSLIKYNSQCSLAITIPPPFVAPRTRTLNLNSVSQKPTLPPPYKPRKPPTFLSDVPTGALYFVGGILFFPLWFVGSFRHIKAPTTPTLRDKSERVQREWRNWNRAMAATCTFFILIILILGVCATTFYANKISV